MTPTASVACQGGSNEGPKGVLVVNIFILKTHLILVTETPCKGSIASNGTA